MRLSSKHLALASEYFQKLMANEWKETKAESGYSYTIAAEEWDQDALIILMNIIHGQTQKLPEKVTLETLAKIAVLVDYYKCHKTVAFFADAWIRRLKGPLPSFYSRELLLRLFVSYVFSRENAFQQLTRTIIFKSRGPIHTLGLPIPEEVVFALDDHRRDLIFNLISELDLLKDRLSRDDAECSFECSSISLGALIKGMTVLGLDDPEFDDGEYDGYSVMAIAKALGDIQTPKYYQPSCYGPTSSISNTSSTRSTSSIRPTVSNSSKTFTTSTNFTNPKHPKTFRQIMVPRYIDPTSPCIFPNTTSSTNSVEDFDNVGCSLKRQIEGIVKGEMAGLCGLSLEEEEEE
ncbi:hypothetical protein LI328DRAFT_169759 [Trichoderma asperelloides]|nr:hypothetical protein LI328DRAFT_169759 [Trichoderma asperelloides]